MSTMAVALTNRALPTLLSQALVAFTVELDNEFELQMSESGYPGARLSLVVWLNLVRLVPAGGLAVQDLLARTGGPREALLLQLGCLERWGFLVLDSGSGDRSTFDIPGHEHTKRRAGGEVAGGSVAPGR
jgi:hypothetical protein